MNSAAAHTSTTVYAILAALPHLGYLVVFILGGVVATILAVWVWTLKTPSDAPNKRLCEQIVAVRGSSNDGDT